MLGNGEKYEKREREKKKSFCIHSQKFCFPQRNFAFTCKLSCSLRANKCKSFAREHNVFFKGKCKTFEKKKALTYNFFFPYLIFFHHYVLLGTPYWCICLKINSQNVYVKDDNWIRGNGINITIFFFYGNTLVYTLKKWCYLVLKVVL